MTTVKLLLFLFGMGSLLSAVAATILIGPVFAFPGVLGLGSGILLIWSSFRAADYVNLER